MEEYVIYKYSCFANDIRPDLSEIFRYMGCPEQPPENIFKLVNNCMKNAEEVVDFNAAYMFIPVNIKNDMLDFNLFSVSSENLSKNLHSLKKCVMFGATIGQGIDRLIAKFSKISPSTALVYQAIGTELIEKFCDKLEIEIEQQFNCCLNRRFSAGYGDFSIEHQKCFFDILKLEKNCGMTLTESLIIRPSKSVTAISGIRDGICDKDHNKCLFGSNVNCKYRKV